ncbi:hypothetical protein BB561_001864 [Smittium simulii]|uniref:DUF2470 domain-containing protein n=1 Tax=Smittium simulii TaxID=133385 RepID=A0A2T9YST6_9FUNG|nr:hypothetical protein BB561_001864 [Smittium simulii]
MPTLTKRANATGNPKNTALKGLKEEINSNHSKCLNLLARHFGDSKESEAATISELEPQSLTLLWELPSSGKVEDMIFTFPTHLTTKAQVLRHLSELVETAKIEANSDIYNSFAKASDNHKMLSFRPPPFTIIFSTIALIASTYYLATTNHPIFPLSLARKFISKHIFWFIFKYTIIAHLIEAFAAFLICRYIEFMFPLEITQSDIAKWIVFTFICGISCLSTLIRKANKLSLRISK